MLYAIGLIVFIIAIILIWFIRYSANRYRAARARSHTASHDPESRRQQTEQVGPAPTLVGVARDVSARVFPAPTEEEYVPFHRRGREMGGVNRSEEDGDPELPSYVESAAMPFPPEPAYTGPPFSRPSAPQTSTRANAPMYDAPPKYVPAQPEQPIVQTL